MDAPLELLSRITDNVALQAGIVLVAFVLLALLADLLIELLARLSKNTKTAIDDRLVKLVRGPAVKTLVLIGLALSAEVLGLSEKVETYTVRALMTVGVLVWMGFAFRFTHALLRHASGRTDRFLAIEERTFPLFDNLVKVLIVGAGVYVVIDTWQVDATGWLASAGIVGIAIGFAAQDTLANLFAGVFIIADAPYQVGDYINLESGERGRVQHIGLRSTRLLTRDDIEITIPNSIMGSARIVNESRGPSVSHRVRVKVGAAYGSDVDEVKRILLQAATDDPQVCAQPEPRVRFRAFGESGLDFELLCWIPHPELRGRILDALNTAVYKRFARAGVEIPYPKRDLYIKQMPPGTPAR